MRGLCRRGVIIAGGAFGLLHNNGGRNWAFAAWASAVGVVYGAAFLCTEVRPVTARCSCASAAYTCVTTFSPITCCNRRSEHVPQDVAVPMAAHSLANLASAALWRRQQQLKAP